MYNSCPFDPKLLTRYSVIRVYYNYPNEPPGEKLFVVVSPNYIVQGSEVVFCLKATSKVARYLNDKDQMAGCVYYKPNELPFFQDHTAVQPDNPLPFHYWRLTEFGQEGKYRVEGKMPESFHERLVAAIRNSITLKPKEQKVMLEMIGEQL